MKSVFDDILDLYDTLGYKVYAKSLNSACYGSATKRERIIIIAVRNDIDINFEFPQATHGNEILVKKYPYIYDDKLDYLPIKTVNDASPTLVPGRSNFPIHPREHRSITVREAATITGFPSDYKFIGSHTKRCESVGNAVSIMLSII